jgi:hypothetical protein
MTVAEQYLQQKLPSILQPGEQAITHGIGMDGLRMMASWIYQGFARYYYVVLTNRRLLAIKMKGQWYPRASFFSRRIRSIGFEEKNFEEIIELDLQDISESGRSTGLGGMIWGRIGMRFHTKSNKALAFVVKRSEHAMPQQKDFYNTIYGKVLEQSKRLLESK